MGIMVISIEFHQQQKSILRWECFDALLAQEANSCDNLRFQTHSSDVSLHARLG